MTIKLNQPVEPDLHILINYLKQVNERGWYTNFGPLYEKLTRELEIYLGVNNLLLVSSGTLALQVVYKVLGVKNAVTTPFSFVATSSSLLWGGVSTQYSDIDPKTGNLCSKLLERTLISDPSIDTVVATHVYGNPCDVQKLEEITESCNVKLIFDAAHAFSISINGESVLNYGDASILSFHATKIFHTIEGGAIIFKKKEDLEKAKRLINFGYSKEANVTDVGINAKLNEYQCAVGLTNLKIIDKVLKHRVKLFELYRSTLKGVVETPKWDSRSSLNGIYMPIILRNRVERKKLESALQKNKIESRAYFSPSLDRVFGIKGEARASQNLCSRVLCLPLHFYLMEADVKSVCEIVKKVIT